MAQVNSQSTQDYDPLMTFVSMLEPLSVASISPKNKRVRSKKPRRNRRIDILNVRHTIVELELQLQILNEKYEFCESLKAPKFSCGPNWRLVVSRERLRIKKASRVNDMLKTRVSDNARVIQRVSRTIDRQGIHTMPVSVQVASQISYLDNEAHVYRVLQACLDFRCMSQVDSIVNQCNSTSSSLESDDWNVFSLENDGIGVDFRESVILPFSAACIGTISSWPPVNKLGIFKGGDLAPATCEFGQRLMLQRLVQVMSRAITLWEDAFCWHDSVNSPRVIVRGSGWVLIAPVSAHEYDLSIVYSGGFIQIHNTDRSHLQATDAVVESIVTYAQMVQRSRRRILEDVLIETLRK